MEEVRRSIAESLELIKKCAYLNQFSPNFFPGLCLMLQQLEIIAKENLSEDDSLLKEIVDLKEIVCKNQI
ncbi:MAG: hypothetical protein ACOYOT_08015 [Bacteroidales bacterium]